MTENIKETEEVVAAGVAVQHAVDEAKADGHIGIEDLGLLFALFPVITKAVDGAGKIPAELADLDEAEAMRLLADVLVAFPNAGDRAGEIAAAALKAAVAAWQLVKIIKAPAA